MRTLGNISPLGCLLICLPLIVLAFFPVRAEDAWDTISLEQARSILQEHQRRILEILSERGCEIAPQSSLCDQATGRVNPEELARLKAVAIHVHAPSDPLYNNVRHGVCLADFEAARVDCALDPLQAMLRLELGGDECVPGGPNGTLLLMAHELSHVVMRDKSSYISPFILLDLVRKPGSSVATSNRYEDLILDIRAEFCGGLREIGGSTEEIADKTANQIFLAALEGEVARRHKVGRFPYPLEDIVCPIATIGALREWQKDSFIGLPSMELISRMPERLNINALYNEQVKGGIPHLEIPSRVRTILTSDKVQAAWTQGARRLISCHYLDPAMEDRALGVPFFLGTHPDPAHRLGRLIVKIKDDYVASLPTENLEANTEAIEMLTGRFFSIYEERWRYNKHFRRTLCRELNTKPEPTLRDQEGCTEWRQHHLAETPGTSTLHIKGRLFIK